MRVTLELSKGVSQVVTRQFQWAPFGSSQTASFRRARSVDVIQNKEKTPDPSAVPFWRHLQRAIKGCAIGWRGARCRQLVVYAGRVAF